MNKDFMSCWDCESEMDRRRSGSGCSGDAVLTDSVPLAMAYVRIQPFDRMYPPETALKRGTLFPDLDLPFCGWTIGGKNA